MIRLHRGNKNLIDEYLKSNFLNQSLIKQLEKGVYNYLDKIKLSEEELLYYEEKEHFLIGTGVDDKITMGDDYFNEKYYISKENNKPNSETIMSILKLAFDNTIDYLLKNDNSDFIMSATSLLESNIFNQYLYESINKHEYYNNRKKSSWETDGRLETVKKDKAFQYIDELLDSRGKKILQLDEKQKIYDIESALMKNKNTRLFLGLSTDAIPQIYTEGDDVDIYYQVPYYFSVEINSVLVVCKALLDGVFVNHTKKLKLPFDFKTLSNNTTDFKTNIIARRYDLQCSFYSKGIKTGTTPIIELEEKTKDYNISNFIFVIESTKYSNPLVIHTGHELEIIGENGLYGNSSVNWTINNETDERFKISNTTGQRTIHKGYKELISELLFYTENGFDVEMQIASSESKGQAYANFSELIFI